MSIKTWKKEFYPIPANETSKEDAVKHSLQKWKGLLPENLIKHRLHLSKGNSYVIQEYKAHRFYVVSTDTCSLCHHFKIGENCSNCPLNTLMGESCSVDFDKANITNNYAVFATTGDPKPMIEALGVQVKAFKDAKTLLISVFWVSFVLAIFGAYKPELTVLGFALQSLFISFVLCVTIMLLEPIWKLLKTITEPSE